MSVIFEYDMNSSLRELALKMVVHYGDHEAEKRTSSWLIWYPGCSQCIARWAGTMDIFLSNQGRPQFDLNTKNSLTFMVSEGVAKPLCTVFFGLVWRFLNCGGVLLFVL